MPSLNVAEYIRECMDSVINQTLKEIEIICVDAGSTDGTLEILREYAEKDSRIQVIISEKKSYGYQMNLGMDAATGEYMGIVETDDYILPTMYEELYKICHQDDLEFAKADFQRFCLDTKELSDREVDFYHKSEDNLYLKEEKLLPQSQKQKYLSILSPQDDISLFKAPLNIWSGIYQFSFLRKNKIRFNETLGASYQDNGFFFQTFSLATKIRFIDKAFYRNRRDNPNSSVHDKGKVYCINEEHDFIRVFLGNHPELEQKLLPIYCFKKYHNYMFTVNRIDDKFKLEYLLRFHQEFLEHLVKKEIDLEIFTERGKSDLMLILKNPVHFYYSRYDATNEVMQNFYESAPTMEDPTSYKIGRFITFLPRKVKGFFRCIKENGLKYTVTRIKQRVKSEVS